VSQFKQIFDHRAAAERFYADVGSNAVRFYDIPTFASDVTPSVYPFSYLEKCTRAVVAVSGSAVEGQEWMVVCPYRVDRDRRNSQMVFDIDPLIMTLDGDSLDPSPVAVIGYHQNFVGRTSPISGCAFSDVRTTVSQLRVAVTIGRTPLDFSPAEVQGALGHMAGYFRSQKYE
jgi:hypothetical protein